MKTRRLQTKSLSVDDAGLITGIAWPFGSPDSYGDVILKGAFQMRDHVPMLWDHDHGEPIGVWESIVETGRGLEVRGRLLIDDVERAREVFAMIKRGAVKGLSVSFWPITAKKNAHGGNDISALELLEISVVSIPAHPDAIITSSKSAKGGKGTKLTKAVAKQTNEKAVDVAANDNVADEGGTDDLDGRVTALETDVAEIKTMLESNAGTVDEIAKSVRTLVSKSGRPAPAIIRKVETPEETARKAFVSYLRQGDKAPEAKSLRSTVDGKGGYLAPPEFVKEMVEELVEYSPVRSVAKVGSTGNSSVIIPGSSGSANAQWVGELEESPESDFGFAENEVPIHELATFIEVPNATLADAEFDLEGHIRTRFAEDIGVKESRAFISGNGIKRPEGFMTRADIQATVSGSASTILADSLISLLYAVPQTYRNQGEWAMNGMTLALVRQLKDGDGRYLWQPSYMAGQPETLLGRPIVEMIDMPDVAAGANPIIYGDWSGYRIYDRSEMDVLVDPYSESKKRKTVFHVTRRTGGGLIEPKKFRKLVIQAS